MADQATDSFTHHRKLLAEFCQTLPEALATVVREEQRQELLSNLEQACQELDSNTADGWHLGQNWLFSFIGNHPQFTPLVPRELLWFFGGDCLHFLSDEEIECFQKIEDRIAEHPELSWSDASRQTLHH